MFFLLLSFCTIHVLKYYRLRIAQEIQRKLEEVDVKLKTLEAEGVEIEKKLRREGNILIYLNGCIYF